jgi:large subunit ribosomal protein L24
MNAAKQAQRLKAIRKVKAALKYREAQKERLKPLIDQRKEGKEYKERMAQHFVQGRYSDLSKARQHAREDWKLGPLRPNRAVGPNADRYGAIGRDQVRAPSLPKYWFGAALPENRSRIKMPKHVWERIPQHILNNHWPIVKDDRVVIVQGREKNKVGIVREIFKDSNEIIVKDLNKVLWRAPSPHAAVSELYRSM